LYYTRKKRAISVSPGSATVGTPDKRCHANNEQSATFTQQPVNLTKNMVFPLSNYVQPVMTSYAEPATPMSMQR